MAIKSFSQFINESFAEYVVGGYNAVADRFDIVLTCVDPDVIEFMDNYVDLTELELDKSMDESKIIAAFQKYIDRHDGAEVCVFTDDDEFKASYPDEWDE